MITILHLYPRELGINGDVGNVEVLAKRAQWRGAEVRRLDHHVGGALDVVPDLVHIGSGPASGQELVWDDLDAIAPTLRKWSAAGVPFVAIAGGWQLLGQSIIGLDGATRAGAGVFETSAQLTSKRTVGERWSATAAGFENFGTVSARTDPIVVDNGTSVGTNLHGPFLPMNPAWADLLLTRAAAHARVTLGEPDARVELADKYALRSRAAIRARLGL